jgi:uncharacterized SAM-binding protein YcdF (DUF218 family)
MLVDLVARALERPLVIRDAFEPLDAIVVLGAPLAAGGSLSPVLAERTAAAAALYRAGGAPLVVATGGVTQGARRAEADAIADGLVAGGVPRAAIVIDAEALATWQNARFTADLLAPRGARRVWLVTQPFHGRRAARLFRAVGLEPRVWHIADSLEYRDRPRAVRWLVREYVSWGALLLRRAP